MRIGRGLRRGLLVAAAVAAAAAVVLYVLACRVPGDYRPARLGPAARDAAMREFRRRLMDFQNAGQTNRPFDWELAERDVNRYLAAMDEIAMQGGAEPGSVRRALERIGLAEPAVAFTEDGAKLMVRLTRRNKIATVLLGFEFTEDERLRIRIDGVRIGQLPLPASVVREKVGAFRRAVVARLERENGDAESPASPDTSKALRRIVAAIDGEPIDTTLTWRLTSRKRVRIDAVRTDAGGLALHVRPVGPG